MFKIIRIIIGIIFIIAGLIGTLIPIPLVPFFLLIVVGLGFLGISKDRIKKFFNKLGIKI